MVVWAKEGHLQDATRGFEEAVARLVQKSALKSALLLLRSYAILSRDGGQSLPLDMERIADLLAGSVQKHGGEIVRNEELRNLLLLVLQDFPLLQKKIGLAQAENLECP
jgi:hypothetical protein